MFHDCLRFIMYNWIETVRSALRNSFLRPEMRHKINLHYKLFESSPFWWCLVLRRLGAWMSFHSPTLQTRKQIWHLNVLTSEISSCSADEKNLRHRFRRNIWQKIMRLDTHLVLRHYHMMTVVLRFDNVAKFSVCVYK